MTIRSRQSSRELQRPASVGEAPNLQVNSTLASDTNRPTTMTRSSSQQSSLQSHVSSTSAGPDRRYKLNGGMKKYIFRNGSLTSDNLSTRTEASVASLTMDDLIEQHPKLRTRLQSLQLDFEERERELHQKKDIACKQLENKS